MPNALVDSFQQRLGNLMPKWLKKLANVHSMSETHNVIAYDRTCSPIFVNVGDSSKIGPATYLK